MLLQLLVSIQFQVCFTPLIGVLFTFPSRYLFTIGQLVVLSLGGWSPQVPSGFHVPEGTQESHWPLFAFVYGGITLCAAASQLLLLSTSVFIQVLQPRPSMLGRFGLFPVRSPLLGESQLISFPAGT